MSKTFILIIVLLIIAGGIFWWQKDNINNLFFGESPKACTQEAKLCPDGSYVSRTGPDCEFAACPEATDTSNWQTYRNEEYGFEVKYPIIFQIEEKNYSSTNDSVGETNEPCIDLFQKENKPQRLLSETDFTSSEEKRAVIILRIYDNFNSLSLDEWFNTGSNFLLKHQECNYLDENWVEKWVADKKDIIIAGIKGIKGIDGCCGTCTQETYLLKGNKIYNISFNGDAGEICNGDVCKKCNPCCPLIEQKIINQILSTFKFIK